MAIEIKTNKSGMEFPKSYSKAVWINLNGYSGEFSAEVACKVWPTAEARAALTDPLIADEHTVLAQTPENKADLDKIRAIVYGMLAREERFKGGKAV